MPKSLLEELDSIVERDPAARNRWEVLTCYPGLHATLLHRPAHWCWTHRLQWVGRALSHLARLLTGIEIHPGARIGRRVFIDHGFGVVIGETAEVGDDCTIYQGVTLGGTTLHRGVKRHPTLERGVVVGAGAQILGAFTVGEYAKVGGNAVVVRAVPARATAVGNPAHLSGRGDGPATLDAAAVQAELQRLAARVATLEAVRQWPQRRAAVVAKARSGTTSLADSMQDLLVGDALLLRGPRGGDAAPDWPAWQRDDTPRAGAHAALH